MQLTKRSQWNERAALPRFSLEQIKNSPFIGSSFAHSANDEGIKHGLIHHLVGVAELAERFANKFGAGELAYLVGLLHDVGKANPKFQAYLEGKNSSVDHKGVGTVVASDCLSPLALIVAGHHGGLRAKAELNASWLPEKQRAIEGDEVLKKIRDALSFLVDHPVTHPSYLSSELDAEFFLRILFSALVDADFLDTERHFNLSSFEARGVTISLEDLWERLLESQAQLTGIKSDPVNRVRDEVYAACLAASEQPQGYFRLTVPTGGGKTRSGMAFALKHALGHNLERVIFAIPYTSIIEQTADVYRGIFGSESVLEHHSAMDPDDRNDEEGNGTSWSRLAAENWDAPVVVTTTVQLFESLFSNKTSKCRKLHNMSKSVVVLDEAQTLPTNLLKTILDGLDRLVADYGATVVFCTATQPSFERCSELSTLPGVREIVSNPKELYTRLRRVEYEWPRDGEAWSWTQVAEKMRTAKQALAIVNTKKDALALIDVLDDPDALHLSTLLCGAHRREVLDEVKRRLSLGWPCKLVSTQVVEAGVDLDFPLVLRAIGPFDRIIQAAGRCNREGRLSMGQVVIFVPEEGGMPPGAYRTGMDTTLTLMERPGFDFDDPAVCEEYFALFFQAIEHDKGHIQELRKSLDYPEVADRFEMIPDDSTPVFVTYAGLSGKDGKANHLLSIIERSAEMPRYIFRRAQPYLVSVNRRELKRYVKEGLAREVRSGFYVWQGCYDDVRGLIAKGIDPDLLVI